MELKGTVLEAKEEVRDFVGSDGVKKTQKIKKVLLMCDNGSGVEVITANTYGNDHFTLPKKGEKVIISNVVKFEGDGIVGKAIFR